MSTDRTIDIFPYSLQLGLAVPLMLGGLVLAVSSGMACVYLRKLHANQKASWQTNRKPDNRSYDNDDTNTDIHTILSASKFVKGSVTSGLTDKHSPSQNSVYADTLILDESVSKKSLTVGSVAKTVKSADEGKPREGTVAYNSVLLKTQDGKTIVENHVVPILPGRDKPMGKIICSKIDELPQDRRKATYNGNTSPNIIQITSPASDKKRDEYKQGGIADEDKLQMRSSDKWTLKKVGSPSTSQKTAQNTRETCPPPIKAGTNIEKTIEGEDEDSGKLRIKPRRKSVRRSFMILTESYDSPKLHEKIKHTKAKRKSKLKTDVVDRCRKIVE